MENLTPDLQEMFAARMQPLRDVLREHRNAHVLWRFFYEEESFAKFETAEIDRALTVIIDAYDERRSHKYTEGRSPCAGSRIERRSSFSR